MGRSVGAGSRRAPAGGPGEALTLGGYEVVGGGRFVRVRLGGERWKVGLAREELRWFECGLSLVREWFGGVSRVCGVCGVLVGLACWLACTAWEK